MSNAQILLTIGSAFVAAALAMVGTVSKRFAKRLIWQTLIILVLVIAATGFLIGAYFAAGNDSNRIAELERRVADLTPFSFSEDQYDLLVQRLAANPSSVNFTVNEVRSGFPPLATRLMGAFEAAGWQVSGGGRYNTIYPPPNGIEVHSLGANGITDGADAIANAFREVGVPFTLIIEGASDGGSSAKIVM